MTKPWNPQELARYRSFGSDFDDGKGFLNLKRPFVVLTARFDGASESSSSFFIECLVRFLINPEDKIS